MDFGFIYAQPGIMNMVRKRSITTGKTEYCREAQEAFEKKYPRSLFFQEFGINYLDDTKSEKKEEHNEKNRQQDTIEDGFIRMETGLDDMPF